MNKQDLINWCWENLQFNNDPENWKDTFIIDIINGYNGICYDKEGSPYWYYEIRNLFSY